MPADIPNSVLVESREALSELPDAVLVSHLKAVFPNLDPTARYGQYVIARQLKPTLDNKEFQQLWEQVSPRKASTFRTVAFCATHLDTVTGVNVQAIPCDTGWSLLWPNGMTGGYGKANPEWFTDRFIPLEASA